MYRSSHYYLSERLPDKDEMPKWERESPQLRQVMNRLRKLYADVKDDYVNKSRAVVQEKLIHPVLELLGFTLTTCTAQQQNPSIGQSADFLLRAKRAGSVFLLYPLSCL